MAAHHRQTRSARRSVASSARRPLANLYPASTQLEALRHLGRLPVVLKLLDRLPLVLFGRPNLADKTLLVLRCTRSQQHPNPSG